MKNLFKDKVAIVTGGASGIGRALCEALSRRDAIVIVADIDTEGAQQVATTITAKTENVRAVRLDVTKPQDVQALVSETASEYGHLDYMFNNAGINISGEVRDLTLTDWHRILDVNLLGVIYGTTAAYSLMMKQGSGHIINVASAAGLVDVPGNVPYGASKHAVVGLSASLRFEAAMFGVKVSAVCPGFINTSMLRQTEYRRLDKEKILARLPPDMIMSADRAAQAILRGVERNRRLIVFPFMTRLMCWLYRIHPMVARVMWSNEKVIANYRAARIE